MELKEKLSQEHEKEIMRKQMDSAVVPIQCFDDLDGKLQNLPHTVYHCGTPQTTVVYVIYNRESVK